ncbi:hypothetical protein AOR04_02440 [Pseudoalteromonas sp. 1_2015MBL_MicDiv]|nr:hypothetical protein AOR04_02440 [Pseudoalteromonas sp. 1_2015MBL_MicDiv]
MKKHKDYELCSSRQQAVRLQVNELQRQILLLAHAKYAVFKTYTSNSLSQERSALLNSLLFSALNTLPPLGYSPYVLVHA